MANYLVVIGHDRLIYNVNEAFAKYLGYTKSNIKGMEYGDISILNSIDAYFKETIMQDEAIVKSMLSNDKLLKFDYKYEARHYVVEIYPLKERESSAERLLLMLSDVTEAKLQDLKMSHSNKMAAIGQLAAGVAHELRNPLGVIRNSTFILDNADSEEDEAHKLIAMKSINNAVKRASGIIDNLLTFSRLTNDRVEVCNLNDLILEVTRYYRKAFKDHSITLLVTCNSDILFETNQESVKHILINLIQNAIDAMEQGGRLTIECEEITDRVSIKVSDDGIGLSEEVKNRIFEPFFTTKPVGKGTGLGLYITYSEVQKINGEIRVGDNTNCGTTFIIEIPKGAS
jgi:polar amino acid transport system substrate-binding protein